MQGGSWGSRPLPFPEKVKVTFLGEVRNFIFYFCYVILSIILLSHQSNKVVRLPVRCFLILHLKNMISYYLLIAKLHAFGLDEDALVFIYSLSKGKKQYFRINDTYSSLQEVISKVPQGSVLGPILCNFCINDFFFFS